VVAFSGRLATPPPLAPSLATPALLIHGDDDSVIPSWESQAAATALQKLGVSTHLHILRGVDHCISSDGGLLAQKFLAERFNLPGSEA
jgi:phospholipase/carboxylesterase